MKVISVLLADDHGLVRAGIKALIEEIRDIKVVAETGDGLEALRLVQLHRPDVVLMDIAMPRLNGLEVTARTKRDFPQVRVIILSVYKGEDYVMQALRAGASGYVLKDEGMEELELAIESVTRGEIYLSPAISKQVIGVYVRKVAGGSPKADMGEAPYGLLTPRQRQILQLIAKGHSSKSIAFHLGISRKTVEAHRMELMRRLDIHDVAGLVRYAIRTGLIMPEI